MFGVVKFGVDCMYTVLGKLFYVVWFYIRIWTGSVLTVVEYGILLLYFLADKKLFLSMSEEGNGRHCGHNFADFSTF